MKKIVIATGLAVALSLPAGAAMAAAPKPHIAKPGAVAKEGTHAHESSESSMTEGGEGKPAAKKIPTAKAKKIPTAKAKKKVKK